MFTIELSFKDCDNLSNKNNNTLSYINGDKYEGEINKKKNKKKNKSNTSNVLPPNPPNPPNESSLSLTDLNESLPTAQTPSTKYLKNGEGIYTYQNGDTFTGTWDNDQLKKGTQGIFTIKNSNAIMNVKVISENNDNIKLQIIKCFDTENELNREIKINNNNNEMARFYNTIIFKSLDGAIKKVYTGELIYVDNTFRLHGIGKLLVFNPYYIEEEDGDLQNNSDLLFKSNNCEYIYEGKFINNIKQGFGKIIYPKQNTMYFGTFHDDECCDKSEKKTIHSNEFQITSEEEVKSATGSDKLIKEIQYYIGARRTGLEFNRITKSTNKQYYEIFTYGNFINLDFKNKQYEMYRGAWRNGMRQYAPGVFLDKEKNIYNGEWYRDKKIQGITFFCSSNIYFYYGTYDILSENNTFQGKGIMIYRKNKEKIKQIGNLIKQLENDKSNKSKIKKLREEQTKLAIDKDILTHKIKVGYFENGNLVNGLDKDEGKNLNEATQIGEGIIPENLSLNISKLKELVPDEFISNLGEIQLKFLYEQYFIIKNKKITNDILLDLINNAIAVNEILDSLPKVDRFDTMVEEHYNNFIFDGNPLQNTITYQATFTDYFYRSNKSISKGGRKYTKKYKKKKNKFNKTKFKK